MPPLPPRTTAPPWRTAWDQALYGPEGFFRRQAPADHFRTSVHGSTLLAEALLRLIRRAGLTSVVDVGAGRGELLRALHALAPDLELLAVEVGGRPADLPAEIGWTGRLPERLDSLVLAHEWLDNVPCHVVEVDPAGVTRLLHVDPQTGTESYGHRLDEPGVPASLAAWLEEWWPLAGPGARAEIGTSRDRAWADVVRRLGRGIALAVDYGHLRADRPPHGSLRSFAEGRQVALLADGSRDVTCDVAVDSVAAAVSGAVLRQREALAALGLDTSRPPLSLASSDPGAYAAALGRATEAAALTRIGGLGDYFWIVSTVGDVDTPWPLHPGA